MQIILTRPIFDRGSLYCPSLNSMVLKINHSTLSDKYPTNIHQEQTARNAFRGINYIGFIMTGR